MVFGWGLRYCIGIFEVEKVYGDVLVVVRHYSYIWEKGVSLMRADT